MTNGETSKRIYRGIFFLASGMTYAAVLLRSVVTYQGTPYIGEVLGILAVFLALFVLVNAFSERLGRWFYIYLFIQTILTCILIYDPDLKEYDYFSLLLAILGMQVLQTLDFRAGVAWLLLFLILIGIVFIFYEGFMDGLIRLLLFGSVIIFLSAYTLAIRRAQAAHRQNLLLVDQLQQANVQLQSYSDTMRQFGVAQERQRLRRELHDSVTQTIFSMTLTTQSALLLLDRDPTRLSAQLDRLSLLAQGALSEMHTLISELRPDQLTGAGLASNIRQHLNTRDFPESLSVSMDVEGERRFSTKEEQVLFRIAQEALNNVVKHANATEACLRLHLVEPYWIEIQDNGQGFNTEQAQSSGQLGLAGMRERADGISWQLTIRSAPGAGTLVRVEKIGPAEMRE